MHVHKTKYRPLRTSSVIQIARRPVSIQALIHSINYYGMHVHKTKYRPLRTSSVIQIARRPVSIQALIHSINY